MAEDKSEAKEVKVSEGQVPTAVNKAIEFGEVPPKLNLAGDLIVGGDAPPPLNLAGQIIEKGMAPQPLPKIPLSQISQPSQPSTGSTDAPKPTSNDTGESQTTTNDNK